MSLISDMATKLAKRTFTRTHLEAIKHELTDFANEIERRVLLTRSVYHEDGYAKPVSALEAVFNEIRGEG